MTKKYSVKDIAYFLSMTIAGLLVIIAGLIFIFGTDIKAIQNDSIRLNDFDNIKYQIQYFISSKDRFPESIQDLESTNPSRQYYSGDSGSKSIYIDPKSKKYYELKYNNDNESFKLCADFEADSDKMSNTNFKYKKGFNCLEYELESYYSQLLKK